jgi:hypothetical protein
LNIFRREGDYRTISFRGSLFRMRDTIGMHYLNNLLANPGFEFPFQEMVSLARRASRKSAAVQSPRKHSNATEAGAYNQDVNRERARLMVTKRIKDVVARIRMTHPELARHLATSIHTGYTCSYSGDDLPQWTT